MKTDIRKWLNKKFPQNYIVRKPFTGVLLLMLLTYAFMILYRPMNVKGARSLSIELTMVLYCIPMAVTVFAAIKLLKSIAFFSRTEEWTILKELLSILIILSVMGITVYFAGFLIEVPAQRWNFATLFNSYFTMFLIGIIPFGFFTLANYRYIFYGDVIEYYNLHNTQQVQEQREELIKIASQLKKEEVSFYLGEFVYAESDGNYVIFNLDIEGKPGKKMVRNSINNVEQQLSSYPNLIRTHRAFIINLKKVSSKKGNSLGYRLKLTGTAEEIPVSRANTKDFDQIIQKYS